MYVGFNLHEKIYKIKEYQLKNLSSPLMNDPDTVKRFFKPPLTNSVDKDQTASVGAILHGSALFVVK